MRVDLLGYLLGALDDAERDGVEEAIRRDPQLQRELETLRERIEPLDELAAEADPPPDLIERTCELVELWREEESAVSHAARPPAARRRWPFRLTAARERSAAARVWSLADTFVAAGIVLAAGMLFFPAIAQSRYRSNIATCQHNLQQLGQSLVSYSDKRGGWFPMIPASGNRGVAGIYAPILLDEGYLAEPRWLVCPSSPLARALDSWHVATLSELDDAQGPQLVWLQHMMGGSYGYTLGYLENGRYRPLRNAARMHLAILSDVPSLHLPGRQSANHGGRGQNVLYEDGHIGFLPGVEMLGGDALFSNRLGYEEAGIDPWDSVIGHPLAKPARFDWFVR